MGTKEHLAEGFAIMVAKESGFYNCRCGWSGNKLAHADENGQGQGLTKFGCSYPNHLPYPPNQEHCPECGAPFAGCFAR